MKSGHRYGIGSCAAVLSLLALSTLTFAAGGSHHLKAGGILTARDCLHCHDGVTGKLITLCLGNECLYLKNHSILHPYPPSKKAGEYASREEVEAAGCILEEGRVTCQSCHDLTKPPPHLIKNGNDLCFICHKALRPDARPGFLFAGTK